MSKNEITIIVDTREQLPYLFPCSQVGTLATGDYSLLGLEDRVAIERKTKSDAYGSLGQGRARFEKEWVRLGKLDFAAVVVECSRDDFMVPPPYSKLNPKSAYMTLLGWSIKYNVHVHWAGSRAGGQALTCQLLEKYFRYNKEGLTG